VTQASTTNHFEVRPWGGFTVLQDQPHYKLKHLVVNPGCRLSLQLHHHRAEQWFIVAGQAQVTVNEAVWMVETGQAVQVPKLAKHRIANLGTVPVELIEVQHGDSFDEADIVRFEDDYNRA
jgi:mannose-6-phosphate isomerase-like protein (cupin superfamily)